MTYNLILQLFYTLESCTLKKKPPEVPPKVIIFPAMFAALGCSDCQVFFLVTDGCT